VPDPASDRLAVRLGGRLRSRRKELGLTLASVARQADVSTSYLSAVENGVNLPSLLILARIVDALDLSMASVVADEGTNHIHLAAVPSGFERVVASHPSLQLIVTLVRVNGHSSGICPVPVAEHDVFVHVRNGQLRLAVDGEAHHLREGDAVDMRQPIAVSWRTGPEGALVLWSANPRRQL
jgi:transcriptional regulator with XRE-family HTH domain